MKIFSRDFWGTVLIWLGVAIFLIVIYDIIRPFFPERTPYPFIQSIQSFFSGGKEAPSRTVARPPDRRPPSPARFPRDSRMLTDSVFSPGNQYREWVWAVKPEHRTGRTVRVEMAHAAEGPQGGFFIIAYADGDGDGKPDRKVAESEFLTAAQPGQWSVFTFAAGEEPLFIGNFWGQEKDTAIFRGNGSWPENNFPLEDRFFYLIDGPNSRSAGPAHTNLRVSFSN